MGTMSSTESIAMCRTLAGAEGTNVMHITGKYQPTCQRAQGPVTCAQSVKLQPGSIVAFKDMLGTILW